MASVQLPPSRFLSNAVAVQLNGTLDKLREDTSQGPQEIPQWTGNWTYGQSNLAVVPLPFSYKVCGFKAAILLTHPNTFSQRASTPGTLPAWQWALVNGESDDRVADLFDPPETQPLPTLQSAPTLQPPPPARHSSSDQIPTQASQPQDPSTQPHASSTHSTNVSHPPVNLPPSSAPATPSTLPPTQTQPHTPDDSWDVSGWWEGSFELQNKQGKQGKVNTIREKFYLRRLEEGRVVGGGTNAYGRFQLYGVLKDVNKLECARAYLQMPRRKRRRPVSAFSSEMLSASSFVAHSPKAYRLRRMPAAELQAPITTHGSERHRASKSRGDPSYPTPANETPGSRPRARWRWIHRRLCHPRSNGPSPSAKPQPARKRRRRRSLPLKMERCLTFIILSPRLICPQRMGGYLQHWTKRRTKFTKER